MDPRLWELVGLYDADVYIQATTLHEGGSTVMVACHAVNDTFPNGKAFTIIFRECKELQCQVLNPNSKADLVQALGMYLGEANYAKPAVVYTGSAEMHVKYNNVEIANS